MSEGQPASLAHYFQYFLLLSLTTRPKMDWKPTKDAIERGRK